MDILEVPWVPSVTRAEAALEIMRRAKRSVVVVQRSGKSFLLRPGNVIKGVDANAKVEALGGEVLPVFEYDPFFGAAASPNRKLKELVDALAEPGVRRDVARHFENSALGQAHKQIAYSSRLDGAARSLLGTRSAAVIGFGPGSAFLLTDKEQTASYYSAVPRRYVCTDKVLIHWYQKLPSGGICPRDDSPVVEAR